ncbi:MAG: hypothetical protein MMC33_007363 [Icmadophila ericetorum]|nr:hypothetical protein [Icmadophila ericetorum]
MQMDGVVGFTISQGTNAWSFELFTDGGDIAAREDGRVSPRGLTSNPSSKENIHLACSWIETCDRNHSSCETNFSQPLPERLLDIGPMDEAKDPFLYISKTNEAGKYAAFSHVWGNTRALRTNIANFEAHQKGISLDQLPRSFRDVVIVTRFLGIRYLWIDALCIIQDSPEDWQTECANMANIYKNSYITIAATDSPNTEAGFLDERCITSPPQTCRIPYINCEGNQAGSMSIRLREEYNELHSSDVVPLTTRAWVLQEKLLSSRILYFGDLQIYWECNTASYQESKGMQNILRGRNRIKDKLLSNRCDMKTWYWLIEDYTARHLTHPHDKLPALSGLAQEFQKKTGFEYVAGLWKEDLLPGLMWEMSKAEGTSIRAKPMTYCGPSWSWASTDGDVRYEKDYELDPVATVIDIKIESGLDPFGRIHSAELTLSGRMKVAAARRSLTDGDKAEWLLFNHSTTLEKQLGRCTFDDIPSQSSSNSSGSSYRTVWCFLLGDISNPRNDDLHEGRSGKQPIPAATLLLTSLKSGYQRVGYAVLAGEKVHQEGDSIKAVHGKDWFKTCKMETVRIH